LSDGQWGLGLLLRRDDGSCVDLDCALLGEVMGLQEALNIIHQWNLKKVIIEMDAQTFVNAIYSRTQHRTLWGKVICHCAKKIKE
jgi:hypothetical protein